MTTPDRVGVPLGARLRRLALYAFTIVFSVMFMFPFLWTLSSSLKSAQEIFAYPPTLIPQSIRWRTTTPGIRPMPPTTNAMMPTTKSDDSRSPVEIPSSTRHPTGGSATPRSWTRAPIA